MSVGVFERVVAGVGGGWRGAVVALALGVGCGGGVALGQGGLGDAEGLSRGDGGAGVDGPGSVVDGVAARVEALRVDGEGERWVRSLVDESESAFGDGDFEGAAAYARLAWEVAGDRVAEGVRERMPMEAAYNEGVARLRLGDYEGARERFRRVRAMRAEGAFERGMVGDAAYNLGVIALSDADAERERREGTRDPLFGLLLGDAEEGWSAYDRLFDGLIGNYLGAAALFAEAMEMEPGDVDAARNYQIAKLRAGALQATRYDAWRERERIRKEIVRPDEAMRTLERLAREQGEERARTAEERAGIADGDVRGAELAGGLLTLDQAPVTVETDALHRAVGRTRELIQGRLGETVLESRAVLETLYEEVELGLWDAVDGQRWAEFELVEGDLGEGESLQAQAERDLLAVLEKLRSRTPPPPPPQGESGDGEPPPPQEGEDQPEPEPSDGEDQEPPDAETGDTRFEDEQLARERAERLRQIFEREEIDLERVRRLRREMGGRVERDW